MIPGLLRHDTHPVDWLVAPEPVPYEEAQQAMRARAAAIADGKACEAVWLVEHPPLYTAGTSARPDDLLSPDRFPVFETGRGGQYTYHGPGQRVVYLMLDLRLRGRDIRQFVKGLEAMVIATLARFNIRGEIRDGRVGVWVRTPGRGAEREAKIAAIGVRVSRWVSFHGLSLNISPDLDHYAGIVPCGISEHGVTSFEDLGQIVAIEEVDTALRAAFIDHFGAAGLPRAADAVTLAATALQNDEGTARCA